MPLTIDDLQPNEGANSGKRRLGRGHGSGRGKTAGRGTKGQNSRAGGGVRQGFEGGQLPIQRRMPYKRGFKNIWAATWETVNIGDLAELQGVTEITPDVLVEAGLVRSTRFPVKVLGYGELGTSLTVKAHSFSKAAKEMIEKAGGTAEELERTDEWTSARPRSRRLNLTREMKAMRVGKVDGPSRREALAEIEGREG